MTQTGESPSALKVTFSLYGAPFQNISLSELLEHQAEEMDLWARAEFSGSESCYCEVARWSRRRCRLERYAFCKALNVAMDLPNDYAKAQHLAGLINAAAGGLEGNSVIHSLPDWRDNKAKPHDPPPSAKNYERLLALRDELADLVGLALPYVEEAADDPVNQKEPVLELARRMKTALTKVDG